MSVEHMAVVFETEGLTGPQKLLLLAYTNYTDPRGYCWPGVDRLAADTGTSKRTVIRIRKELEARNLLRHQRRTKKSGESDTSLYRVNLDKLRSMRRKPTDFDDDVLGMKFEDDPPSPEIDVPEHPCDQPKCQSATPVTSRSANLPPPGWQSATPGGGNLTPNPSSDPSVIPYPDPDARADGRTDGPSVGVTEKHQKQARTISDRLDLRKIDARPKQVREIRSVIAAALARGVAFDVVVRHAEMKLIEANTCKYFQHAFSAEYLPAGPSPEDDPGRTAVPWCGQCDPEGCERPNLRRIEIDGAMRRCPQCHPVAAEIA